MIIGSAVDGQVHLYAAQNTALRGLLTNELYRRLDVHTRAELNPAA